MKETSIFKDFKGIITILLTNFQKKTVGGVVHVLHIFPSCYYNVNARLKSLPKQKQPCVLRNSCSKFQEDSCNGVYIFVQEHELPQRH